MKRRTFIQLVGASALGLPFVYSKIGSGAGKNKPAPTINRNREPLALRFSTDEAAVIDVLNRRSKTVCLLGGGVLAKAAGTELPYLNLLTDCAQFRRLKTELFEFGVTPVSTAEMPSHFIRFVYQGKPYGVLNMNPLEYERHNVLGRRLELLPVAHNFLVYSAGEQTVVDPYGALKSRGMQSPGFRGKIVELPRSVVAGLETCLAVAFDNTLLGIESPVRHEDFEREVLSASAGDEPEATAVFHRMLSYFPDLVELKGWECTRKYLLSPLCVSAGVAGPKLDLQRVEAVTRAAAGAGKEISGAHLLAAFNDELKRAAETPALLDGLPDYLAARKMPFRRKDLLEEVLSVRQTA